MLEYIKNFKKSELAMASLLLLVLTIVANFLSLLYQVSMAWILKPIDYGILAVLTNFIYIFTIPTYSIQTLVSKYTTNFAVKTDYAGIKGLLFSLIKKTLFVGALFFILFAVVSIYLSQRLGISYSLLILTGVFIFGAFIYPVGAGVLQGMKKFKALGINGIIGSIVKLFVALILVFIGFKVYGAIIGFILGTLISFGFIFLSLNELKSYEARKENLNLISKTNIATVIAMLILVLLYSLDVIFAKALFEPEIAGKYAIISMIGKIVLFVILAIGTAMFPINSEKFARGHETKQILRKVLLASIAVCGIILIFFAFFPKFVMSLLFLSKYADYSGMLIYIGVAFSMISLLNLIVLYQVSLNKIRKTELLSLGIFLIFEVTLFIVMSKNIEQFSIGFMISSIFAFLGGLLWLLRK